MIRFIHKNQKSIVLVLSLVLALSMLSFGVDYSGNGQQKYAIKVNKEEISFDQFEIERNQLMNQLQSMYGSLYNALISSGTVNLKQMTVDRIVNTTLLKQVSEEYGFQVGDQGLVKSLASQLGGKVDSASYQGFLKSINQTAQSFEAKLRESEKSLQMMGIFKDLTQVSDLEAASLVKADLAKYKLQYVEFDPEKLNSKVVLPSEEDLKKFFDEKITEYEVPEKVAYEYSVITPDQVQGLVQITDEDLELYYSEREKQYTEPESVKLSVIKINLPSDGNPELITKAKLKAEQAYTELSQGKKFFDIAKKYSEDSTASSGGDLGWIARGSVNSKLEEIYFSSLAMGFTKPIELDQQIYILNVLDYKEQKTKTLAEVKPEIERYLRQQDAPIYASEYANDLFTKWTEANESLASFVAKNSLSSKSTSDKLSKLQDPNPELPGLTAKILEFPQDARQIITIGDQQVLVEIKDFSEKYFPEFSQVKDQVIKNYIKQTSVKLSENLANDLLSKLTDGVDLASLASSEKLKLELVEAYSPAKPGEGILADPELARLVAGSQAAKKLPKVLKAAGKQYVFQVKELKPASEEEVKAKIPEYKKRYAETDTQLLLQSFIELRKANSEVDVDPSLLAS